MSALEAMSMDLLANSPRRISIETPVVIDHTVTVTMGKTSKKAMVLPTNTNSVAEAAEVTSNRIKGHETTGLSNRLKKPLVACLTSGDTRIARNRNSPTQKTVAT